MTIDICDMKAVGAAAWDDYVMAHPEATLYHLSGWRRVIRETYGHQAYYLMAKNSDNGAVTGVLPLIRLKHFVFGNCLLSMPFFDMGGVLADTEEIEQLLLQKAVTLGRKLGVNNIELRHTTPRLIVLKNSTVKSHKVRMVMELPESSDALMKSFNSKFRNKIKKPMRAGLECRLGGLELLRDFYHVFAINMRDLGSPVHSKRFIENVLKEFPEKAKIGIVYMGKEPIACILVFGFQNVLANPWASALREYGNLRANTLQYWTLLEYACDNGYSFFDFGRSSPDEGTYKFKAQWGARPHPLHWHYIWVKGRPDDEDSSKKSKFEKAIQYWQMLPVPVTKIIGPAIRKHIGL